MSQISQALFSAQVTTLLLCSFHLFSATGEFNIILVPVCTIYLDEHSVTLDIHACMHAELQLSSQLGATGLA